MRQVCCISSTPAAPALCRVRPKVKTVLFSLGLSTLQPVHPVYYCSDRLSVLLTKDVNFSAAKPPLSTHCSEKLTHALTSHISSSGHY